MATKVITDFELSRQWAIDSKNGIRFNKDGSIAIQRWNQRSRKMETLLALSASEAQQLRAFLEAAQQSVQRTGVCLCDPDAAQSYYICDVEMCAECRNPRR